MEFTPEQRKLYPSHIWVIKRKWKTDIMIDADQVSSFVRDLNANDFVWVSMYETTVHKFEVEDISVVEVTDDIKCKIFNFVNKRKRQKTALSFNDSIEWLRNSMALPQKE